MGTVEVLTDRNLKLKILMVLQMNLFIKEGYKVFLLMFLHFSLLALC